MGKRMALTGNDAGAYAFKHANADVAAAFPITPQTELMHKFAEFVADGDVDTELILVESEHSAMSACVGSAAGGARTFTATAANGFALMWEIVYIAASCRLPIVMAVVNRALSGPINIHNDHSDSMGGRDSGWIQLYSENSQEAYDNILQCFRIAEHPDVLLPALATLDGFVLSHTVEAVEILDDDVAAKFVGKYKPHFSLLDIDNPVTVGPLDLQDYYFEHKRQQVDAMEKAFPVIKAIGKEFGDLTGRYYSYYDEYKLEDAEAVVIALGSAAGTTKAVVDELRAEGQKVGMIKLRMFRPFPYLELRSLLKNFRAVGIMDRCISFGGYGGPVFNETRSALYGLPNPPVVSNFLYGLGGRDISTHQIREIFETVQKSAQHEPQNLIHYVGVRE
ncbi:pyruvate ferredoxin oxidoreductase [bacterium]|nr:pyruvate ferredoxin oxidoreductase [bacterium]